MIKKLFVSDEHSDLIVDQDGIMYASANGNNSIERAARAHRIVACVNACAGISTENLEDNLPVKELAHRYNKAKKERDELLAALENARSAHLSGQRLNLSEIDYAIARVKGGAK